VDQHGLAGVPAPFVIFVVSKKTRERLSMEQSINSIIGQRFRANHPRGLQSWESQTPRVSQMAAGIGFFYGEYATDG